MGREHQTLVCAACQALPGSRATCVWQETTVIGCTELPRPLCGVEAVGRRWMEVWLGMGPILVEEERASRLGTCSQGREEKAPSCWVL